MLLQVTMAYLTHGLLRRTAFYSPLTKTYRPHQRPTSRALTLVVLGITLEVPLLHTLVVLHLHTLVVLHLSLKTTRVTTT